MCGDLSFMEVEVHAGRRDVFVVGTPDLDDAGNCSIALIAKTGQVPREGHQGCKVAYTGLASCANRLVQGRGAFNDQYAGTGAGDTHKLKLGTRHQESTLGQVCTQRIAVTQVVVIQVCLWVGIMPVGLHLHRVNQVPSVRALNDLHIAAWDLPVEASKDTGEGHDVLIVVGRDRVAIAIQDFGTVGVQLHGANCEELHDFSREILVGIVLVMVEGRIPIERQVLAHQGAQRHFPKEL
mmetsp:Transcript_45701/g.106825  ORF Transcript_45701/g.106825 Transcript_45701/m.106825 type:complete len:238 (+) Transcript_45701:2988-3701(+)